MLDNKVILITGGFGECVITRIVRRWCRRKLIVHERAELERPEMLEFYPTDNVPRLRFFR